MTNGTVLVASPSAIGRQPEASGSSVPAWPARLAVNSRLITDTAWVDVMPTGLSSTTQPCTSRFLRLNCCALPGPRGRAGDGADVGEDGSAASATIGPPALPPTASTAYCLALPEFICSRLDHCRDRA